MIDIDIENQINKILKTYREWQETKDESLALDCEREIDMLKLAIGDRFYELTYFERISLEVSKFLNNLDRERDSEKNEEDFFSNQSLDKVGKALGIS